MNKELNGDENTNQENDDEIFEEEELEEEEEETPEEEPETDEKDNEIAKLRAIVQKKNKKLEKLQTQGKSTDDDLDEDLKNDIEYLKLSDRKRQFQYEHGLSPQETDKIFSINPKPTADTLKDPFIRGGLRTLRKKEELKNNIPSSTSTKSSPYSSKDFQSLSAEEKQSAYEKRLKGRA